MVKYLNIIYFLFSAFVLCFGVLTLVGGEGKLWMNICILLVGLYFLYRGVALTVNNRRGREED